MQKPNLKLKTRFTAAVAVGLALAFFTAGATMAKANSQPFTRIYVFGDSLSDSGNFYRLSGGAPPAPYWEGRFSNGGVWVELLAKTLDMTIAPGDNYATGGATTGFDNYRNGFNGRTYPGLQDEIASFKATHTPQDAQGALFIVWAGANDFFVALEHGQSAQALIGNGVANTVAAVQQLYQCGARHIMVVNVPDLGVTPFARGAGLQTPVTQLSAAYNQVLASALDSLAAAGIQTIRVDAFTAMDSIVSQPDEFGFSNVTTPLLYTGLNTSGYLFWDTVHPTTEGHAVFAEVAANALMDYYSPRQGRGTPAARLHALNGLVNASEKN